MIPVDKVLPFLATALDEQAMGGIFAQHFQSRDGFIPNITECAIERIKYRPGRNCLVGYRLTLRDEINEREQRLCAGIYAADDARARYEKAMSAANVATPNFPPVMALSHLNMVVWAFPNERKLSALPLFADDSQLRQRLLPEVVRARWGDGWEIIESSHRVSNYFPEHSCCINVSLKLREMKSEARKTWDIIGKMRCDAAGVQTHAHMSALRQTADCDVAYARPLIYQDQYQVQWQERVHGVPLHSLLMSGDAHGQVAARVGKAIAALHRTSLPETPRVTTKNLIDNLNAAHDTIASAWPNCAVALSRTVNLLIARSHSLSNALSATCHGDLHSNNILVGAEQIFLVDMDDLANGPPLADLGSFLAELIYRGFIGAKPLGAIQSLVTSVIAAYRQAVPWPVADAELAWYIAGALIHERALRCVTSLKPVGQDAMDRIIAAAAAIVDAGNVDQCFAPANEPAATLSGRKIEMCHDAFIV
jgi:aminoglycoside phosphotransferase (APT) family kinase protein